MYNEPITFEPAAREIAHEVAALVRRLRASVAARRPRGANADATA